MSLKAIFLYQGEIIEATKLDREMNDYSDPAILLIDVEGRKTCDATQEKHLSS
jgi:hypothetical protein